jgi:hypothetical protein
MYDPCKGAVVAMKAHASDAGLLRQDRQTDLWLVPVHAAAAASQTLLLHQALLPLLQYLSAGYSWWPCDAHDKHSCER